MIKTETEYEEALKHQVKLERELKRLDSNILLYKNEFKIPSFTNIKDLKDFIMYDALEGALVKFEDITYKVSGAWEEMRSEYGSESADDSFNTFNLDGLTDGFLEKQ